MERREEDKMDSISYNFSNIISLKRHELQDYSSWKSAIMFKRAYSSQRSSDNPSNSVYSSMSRVTNFRKKRTDCLLNGLI